MPTVLVTRPEPDARISAVRLRALGLDSVLAPLLNRVILDTALPEPGPYTALALTSANAVRALKQRDAIAPYRHLPVYTVGGHTAIEAEIAGFLNVTSAEGAFGDLVHLLAHRDDTGPILYPAGTHLSGDLERSLQPFAMRVDTVPVYRMDAATTISAQIIERIEAGEIHAVLHYSRRSAQAFVDVADSQLSARAHRELTMLCMSEAVAQPLLDSHFVRIELADHVDDEAMMALALSFAREHNSATLGAGQADEHDAS